LSELGEHSSQFERAARAKVIHDAASDVNSTMSSCVNFSNLNSDLPISQSAMVGRQSERNRASQTKQMSETNSLLSASRNLEP